MNERHTKDTGPSARWPLGAAILLVCGACGEQSAPPAVEDVDGDRRTDGAQAVSLLGEPLRPPDLADDARMGHEEKLREAEGRYQESPDDADAIIWLGRRQAYLGRYRDAIATFTEGIEKHPDDPRMYRHRGHRHITVRELDRAIADLGQAAQLIRGTEDEIEPDGLPNDRNIPTGTLHSNIWYHLGLARYLKNDLDAALQAYRACERVSTNPDMLVATTYWLYLTLQRMGRTEEAATALEPITAGMDIIENDVYHRLLLLYRGELEPEALTSEEGAALDGATLGYGVVRWHEMRGENDQASELASRVLEGPQWATFGYIATEADAARRISD
jgi:tetratricopeptide (TPR) repeat protein